MKITALIENNSRNINIASEHGLSLFIELDNKNILFDMGQSNLFYTNAKTLGLNISSVEVSILSHGHYDHGGGLESFLEVNKNALVYIHKDAFLDYYNGSEKYIGLDKNIRNNKRIVFIDKSVSLFDNIIIDSLNNKQLQYKSNSDNLNVKTDNNFTIDSFNHELYLIINYRNKKILFSGCAHKGILNILDYFKPDIFIGGMHLNKVNINDKEEVKVLDTLSEMIENNNIKVYACHCTGKEQFNYLKNKTDKIEYLYSGEEIEIL